MDTDTIEDIAPTIVGIDLEAMAITIEFTDKEGQRAAVLLDSAAALDLALKLIGGMARLRKWEGWT